MCLPQNGNSLLKQYSFICDRSASYVDTHSSSLSLSLDADRTNPLLSLIIGLPPAARGGDKSFHPKARPWRRTGLYLSDFDASIRDYDLAVWSGLTCLRILFSFGVSHRKHVSRERVLPLLVAWNSVLCVKNTTLFFYFLDTIVWWRATKGTSIAERSAKASYSSPL